LLLTSTFKLGHRYNTGFKTSWQGSFFDKLGFISLTHNTYSNTREAACFNTVSASSNTYFLSPKSHNLSFQTHKERLNFTVHITRWWQASKPQSFRASSPLDNCNDYIYFTLCLHH